MSFPRTELARYTKKLAQIGLITGSEGNLSLKTREGLFTTPSGRLKADLRPEDIVLVDEEGRIREEGRPSSEIRLHLLIYKERPEIKAVIHAHPPYTLALDLAGHNFSETYLAEAEIFLKKIQRIPFAVPGSEELAKVIKPFLGEGKVFVLSRHGALTLGHNLAEAFNLMCVLEQTSRIIWLAKALTPEILPLQAEDLVRLKEIYS